MRTVAILAAQPALNALLAAVLAGSPNLRVRSFESELALQIYMRITRVDLVVIDAEGIEIEALDLLRSDEDSESTGFVAVALADDVSAAFRRRADDAGVAEIIVKPMSPRYLLERVQARLSRLPIAAASPRQSRPADYSGFSNVIPLWTKDRPHPRPGSIRP